MNSVQNIPDLIHVLGNSTYAAITAVAAANIVLVLYIIFSMMEDSQGKIMTAQTQLETKKER
jgi:hypothetical protein